tara:strand:- start:2 stop:208 length:207 start_codon:yes stop_codon:yes gene_type:complete
MIVKELIEYLNKIENKELPIRVIEEEDYSENGYSKPNFWLTFEKDIEVSDTGQSGYEQSGEVRLIGKE